MPVHPFLKSPTFLTGFGFAGSGAAGIGGGQIYEGAYPTINSSLYKKGYRFSPIQPPNEGKPVDANKFTGKSGGCFEKLFPGIEVKRNEVDGTHTYSASSEESPKSSANFISCSIMELRPVSSSDASKGIYQNRIYFKSELVIKGEKYGGVLWTGLSTAQAKDSTQHYSNSLDFVYSLLFLEKGESGWKINSGYEGFNYSGTNFSAHKIFIETPEERGINNRPYVDDSSFETRKGAGIGEVDNSYNKEVLQGMPVYIDNANEAEILGNDGTFNISNHTPGYTQLYSFYSEHEGGKSSSNYANDVISKDLVKGYAPFKGKKVKWTEMSRRCSSWSRSRNLEVPFADELNSLCYTPPNRT